jgi:SAM-dependent methyltransferase
VTATAVLWHDLECGGYGADLPLWRELAAEHAADGGAVLDLGAGTGRVALDLARAGHDVVALDLEATFLDVLRERATAAGIAARALDAAVPAGEPRADAAPPASAAAAHPTGSIETLAADARDFELPGRRFPLVLAPMQTVQLLGGPAGRARFLAAVKRHLAPGGLLACSLADALDGFDAEHSEPPLPDMVERDGWVYVSQPVAVRPRPEGITIERIRQSVSPEGRRTAEGDAITLDVLTADTLAAEGVAAGLRDAGRRAIPATDEHVGSAVVLLAAPGDAAASPDAAAPAAQEPPR